MWLENDLGRLIYKEVQTEGSKNPWSGLAEGLAVSI